MTIDRENALRSRARTPVGGAGATGSSASHPGEVFVSGGEGAPGLLANAGNACLNVPGLVGLDK